MPNYWLAVGPPENWRTAFEHGNTWGLTERQKGLWNKLAEGDVVVFYATKPVSGAVGFGGVQTKFRQDQPLWPQETGEGRVLWPLRFEFSVEHCLPPDEWVAARVTSDTLKLKAGMGFHAMQADLAGQVISQLTPHLPQAGSSHDEAKRKLVDIGRLQGYLAEAEYSFDIGRLDVVWRRVQNSVPTYVFEVQVGGDVYHALAKLKHAFDLWNSHIFIVAAQSDRVRVDSLLSGTFHEIGRRVRFIELDKVEELLTRKRAYRELEDQLGITGSRGEGTDA